MEPFHPLSTSDQLTEHLRREILKGTFGEVLPGVKQLVQGLGVNSVAVSRAVQQLEREGLVKNQGDRRCRLITINKHSKQANLRVGLLYYDHHQALRHDVLSLKQELHFAGFSMVPAPKTMLEMEMAPKRTARLIKTIEADAWIVFTGSGDILQWFEQQPIPAFALHGRLDATNLAGIGVRKSPVLAALIHKLVGWGHRRIVFLARKERRVPSLGGLEQFFMEQLMVHGISTSEYNIPDWEDSPEGLGILMHSLFQYTPPTALVVGDAKLFHSVQIHLAHKGILAPQHVSLFCNDSEQSFEWVRPLISHVQWDYRPTIRRVVQWAHRIAQGQSDIKKGYIDAEFFEGETIGPSPKQGRAEI